jgi:hypothetical protein
VQMQETMQPVRSVVVSAHILPRSCFGTCSDPTVVIHDDYEVIDDEPECIFAIES